jgi:VCBS repeat-containing protein
LETLEVRRLLAFITVDTADGGPLSPGDGSVSLREAISAINAGNDLGDADIIAQSPGTFGIADQIGFDIDGGGAQTIRVTSGLPSLSKPVVLDASTQPGFAGTPLITIDGATAAGASDGLTVNAHNSTIRGFRIQNFKLQGPFSMGGKGIVVSASGLSSGGPVIVAGNVIVDNASGMTVFSKNGYVIGGTSPADRNVISGNLGRGISATDSFISGFSRIQGNYIGVDEDGVTPRPNGGQGIFNFSADLEGGSFLVGGSVPEAGNVIAYNGGAGVNFYRSAIVRHNSIFANGGLGIDNLVAAGNDPLDADIEMSGSANPRIINILQNHPVLASAISDGASVTVSGLINTNPFAPFLIDFYAGDTPDSFGKSHGKTYLGTVTVITDNAGNATFAPTFAIPAGAGGFITATATSTIEEFRGETSEFSAAVAAGGPAPANSAPDANDDAVTTSEDTAVSGNVLANDTDGDADTLTATVGASPSHGTLYFNPNGTFTYTPASNYNGSDSFTYTASDGHGHTDSATVHLNMTPGNDAPVGYGKNVIGTRKKGFAGVIASFADLDTTSVAQTRVTIQWGDGRNSDGTIVYNATTGLFDVIATHLYSRKGKYTATIVFSDAAGAAATATSTVNILEK